MYVLPFSVVHSVNYAMSLTTCELHANNSGNVYGCRQVVSQYGTPRVSIAQLPDEQATCMYNIFPRLSVVHNSGHFAIGIAAESVTKICMLSPSFFRMSRVMAHSAIFSPHLCPPCFLSFLFHSTEENKSRPTTARILIVVVAMAEYGVRRNGPQKWGSCPKEIQKYYSF